MVHQFFDPAQAAAFNEICHKKDSTFELRYFGLHGLGAISRTILAVSGAKFTNVITDRTMDDWASEKPKTPFGVLPLLKETSSDGRVINIAESDAIERYLSEKFDLYGSDAFEKNLVNTFVAHSNGLVVQLFLRYYIIKDAVLKAENKEMLVSTIIADWVKYHEQHLTAAGASGHYVGNKTTIADIKTAHLITMLQGFTGEDLISEAKTPALMKVKATVEMIPSLAAWRETEEYKAMSERNFNILGFR
ncbi:hypothetical protein EDD21DRAFT_363171 [Dissophora ornata]|nr:hypothetical protein EDD21DRAFT_363171 [Dissophora ornata]